MRLFNAGSVDAAEQYIDRSLQLATRQRYMRPILQLSAHQDKDKTGARLRDISRRGTYTLSLYSNEKQPFEFINSIFAIIFMSCCCIYIRLLQDKVRACAAIHFYMSYLFP